LSSSRPPVAHGLDKLRLVFGADLLVERAGVESLGQQLGDVAFEVDRQLLVALRLAAKGVRAVDEAIGVVLDERLELDPERPCSNAAACGGGAGCATGPG
jgi:hypothetical protein